MQKIKRDLW